MANPNIFNATSIYGKTAVQAVGTSAANIVENTSASGKIIKINSLTIANVDGVDAADITVDIFRSSVAYKIAHTVRVPADSTLVVISKDTAIYLEEGDALRCLASAASDLEAVCSYEEIS
jgi:hypothetical protein